MQPAAYRICGRAGWRLHTVSATTPGRFGGCHPFVPHLLLMPHDPRELIGLASQFSMKFRSNGVCV